MPILARNDRDARSSSADCYETSMAVKDPGCPPQCSQRNRHLLRAGGCNTQLMGRWTQHHAKREQAINELMETHFFAYESTGTVAAVDKVPRVSVPHLSDLRGGYLYCLELTGACQGSRSVNPLMRLRTHCAAARGLGIQPIRVWVSPAHQDFHVMEIRMLEHLAQCATEALGPENFRGDGLLETVHAWWRTQGLLAKPLDVVTGTNLMQA